MTRRISISLVLALLLCVAAVAQASAVASGDFRVTLTRPPYVPTPTGEVSYEHSHTTSDTTIRLMHGASELTRNTSATGNTRADASFAALQPGDVVEVFQPGIPAGPTAVSPTAQYVIPNLSLSGTAGATTISGSSPDGALARIHVSGECDDIGDDSLPVNAAGGTFSSATKPLAAGADLSLYVFSGAGDYTEYRTAVPGETPCFSADAYPYPEQPTLDPAGATPFHVRVRDLKTSVAINSRLVWRRGATIIGDTTNLGDEQFGLASATQPRPGDVLEIYRPQTALTPSRSVTVPQVTATIDTAASLVAVNSTAIAGYLDVFAFERGGGDRSSRRDFLSPPAGRTLADFNTAAGMNRPYKMSPDGRALVDWYSADWGIQYNFEATPGDLVAPVVSARFKSRLRLAKIRKSIAVRLNSNEAATGTAAIVVAKRLPGKGHPRTKPGKRTLTFATAKLSLKAGSKTVNVKLTKAGRKALKQLRGAGKTMIPVKATIKLTLTDPSGNAATVTRTMKLVVR